MSVKVRDICRPTRTIGKHATKADNICRFLRVTREKYERSRDRVREMALADEQKCVVEKLKDMMRVFIGIVFVLFLSVNPISSAIVKFLPGFSGRLPFKLETGYIGVDESNDEQLFYYFIESEGNPRKDPLVLWLTGGPACSALSGLIFEIGPILFNMVEYNGSLPTLALNPHSWTKVSSIIFLDSPVGTGFSYTRRLLGSITGDKKSAHSSFDFLRKWLSSHPEFITNKLYIGGDSYSGLTVPIFVQEISNGIEAGHKPPINLKGYLLGNPATDSRIDQNSKIPFAHRMALISDELYMSTKRNCKGEYVKVDSLQCAKDLQAVYECLKLINIGHILEHKCGFVFRAPTETEDKRRYLEGYYVNSLLSGAQLPKFGCRNYNDVLFNIWANDYRVQKGLHVREGTIREWIRCKKDLPYIKEVRSTVSYHLNLSTRGYRALLYSGDHDMAVPYLGTELWIKSLNFSIVVDWRPWMVDGQVAGYKREFSNGFTFATVKGGGHTAPEYMPKECFAMFGRWIAQEPL